MTGSQPPPPPNPTLIDRDELLRRRDDARLTVVNVLPAAAFGLRRIPRSVNLPLAEVRGRAGQVLPDRSQELAVHCTGPG